MSHPLHLESEMPIFPDTTPASRQLSGMRFLLIPPAVVDCKYVLQEKGGSLKLPDGKVKV